MGTSEWFLGSLSPPILTRASLIDFGVVGEQTDRAHLAALISNLIMICRLAGEKKTKENPSPFLFFTAHHLFRLGAPYLGPQRRRRTLSTPFIYNSLRKLPRQTQRKSSAKFKGIPWPTEKPYRTWRPQKGRRRQRSAELSSGRGSWIRCAYCW